MKRDGEYKVWLTAWAAVFSLSCMRVGLFFGFLGLGVRSAWLLWPSCESTRLLMSSPTLPELLLDGTFSLLVSPVTEGALLSDEKEKGEEIRHLPSIGLSLCSPCSVLNQIKNGWNASGNQMPKVIPMHFLYVLKQLMCCLVFVLSLFTVLSY